MGFVERLGGEHGATPAVALAATGGPTAAAAVGPFGFGCGQRRPQPKNITAVIEHQCGRQTRSKNQGALGCTCKPGCPPHNSPSEAPKRIRKELVCVEGMPQQRLPRPYFGLVATARPKILVDLIGNYLFPTYHSTYLFLTGKKVDLYIGKG